MEIRAFIGGCRTNGLDRITAKRINSEDKQHNASQQLQIENIFIDIIKNKTHPVSGKKRIGNIAQRSSQTCHKAIPTSFVQGTLDTQDSDRSQRSRDNNADSKALY